MNQAVCHRSKKIVVGRSNVWRVRRIGWDLPFQRFPVCLDQSCDMSPSIVMMEDNFVVSLLVLWPFLLQCSAQTYQLCSIPIPCDDFTWFQQLITHHTELVPPNAEHNLGTVNIRSGRQRESWLIHMALRRFEMAFRVIPNDSANSSCVWNESSVSNASNSESSKIFSFPHQNHRSWSVEITHTFFHWKQLYRKYLRVAVFFKWKQKIKSSH